MADAVTITQPGELPPWWQDQWHLLRRAYEKRFQGRRSRRWCEQESFYDIRRAYLAAMAAVMMTQAK